MVRKTSSSEDREIADAIREQIDSALDADYTWIIEWVEDNCEPEDVFDDDKLGAWALDNGFTKEE
jgi:hypothetical protein